MSRKGEDAFVGQSDSNRCNEASFYGLLECDSPLEKHRTRWIFIAGKSVLLEMGLRAGFMEKVLVEQREEGEGVHRQMFGLELG